MTEKIYYTDAYVRSFEAEVTDCREHSSRYEVVLSATAFYPEGGGQPGDRGYFICEGRRIEVFDTHEKAGEVLHYVAEPIPVGTRLTGHIDWMSRYDNMQNHSGEHIVSGLINARYGYNNVGFHMGSEFITIDFDGEIPPEELTTLEISANRAIWDNETLDIRFHDEEAVKCIEFRSKKELKGEVRIVTIPGADVCACCGTHVARTGEIGLIKLISMVRNRGGVRIEMLCGRRALAYIDSVVAQNTGVSVALSAKPLETEKAVLQLKEHAAELSYRLVQLEEQQFERIAGEYAASGDVLLFEDGLSADGVRKLCVLIMECCGGRCAVFSGNDKEGYKYAIGLKDGDLRNFVKNMNAALDGRGGGKPFFVQGSVQAYRKRIEEFFDAGKVQ